MLHVKTIDYFNVEDSSIEYLHRDHLGSVEAITDEQGAELHMLAYDPYGERRKDDWSRMLDEAENKQLADALRKRSSRGFTGQENLDRTGFVHMNGRVYDPQIGRFLSPDPIVQSPTYSQSWNRYGFVMNSPMSFTDPSGFVAAGPGCGVFSTTMCLSDNSGAGPASQPTSIPSQRATIYAYAGYVEHTVYVPGRSGGDVNGGGYRGFYVTVITEYVYIKGTREDIENNVHLPDESETDQPIDMTGAEVGRFENEIQLAKDIGAGVFDEFVVAPIRDFAEGKILSGACRAVKVCSAAKRLGKSVWKFGENVFGNGKADAAKGTPKPRTNKLGPNPKAEGPHTQFKTDPKTGKVTGYTEFDAAGNPVKRFRGQGKPHGGTEPPFILEPKPGKGPGAPPKVPRQPRPDELPRGY